MVELNSLLEAIFEIENNLADNNLVNTATNQTAMSDFKLLIDSIPVYDGNPKTLTQFIVNVEEINELLNALPNQTALQKRIAFLAIKTKIVGRANEQLRNFKFESWIQLKEHLISNFANRQNPESIIIEIIKSNSNNKNVFRHLSEIKEKFDMFRAKINLTNCSPNSRDDTSKN